MTDFGLVKEEGSGELTSPGDVVGTLRYMPPERFQGQADLRSDIYGLGLTLYEMLTLTPAFEDTDRARLMDRVQHEEPPRPRKLDPRIPRDLETIVLKAIAKEPGGRYATATAFAEDLRRFLADRPIHARRSSWREHTWRWCRRNPAVASLTAAVVLAFLVAAGAFGWALRDRTAREQELARVREARQAKLNQEVELALGEASALRERALTLPDNPYQWEATLAAAASAFKRADGLAAQEEGGLEPAVHKRLEVLRAGLDADENDRRFVARCDKIRHEALSQAKLEIVFPAFEKAFQSHYAIAFGATPPEKVLNCLEQRPFPVRQYLVAALDSSLAFVPKEDPQAREWLAAVLQAVDSSDPWRKQARAAMEARDWQALSKLLAGPGGARQAPVVLLGLAARYQWDGPTSVEFWRYIRQSYPGDFWANHALACMLHYFQGRLEEAIRYYTAAIALRPRSPECYVNLGNALWGKGALDEAIAVYRQATAIAPRYAAAHEQLGLALERKGCLDEAIAELRQAIRFRDDARGHLLLGNVLARNGLLDDAIASFRKAIALDPKLGVAHYNLSAVLLDKKECLDAAIASHRNAIACYRGAIALNPGDGASHNELAWILVTCANVQLRDPAEGVKLARKAIDLVPSDGSYRRTLGAAHYRAGDWKEAVAALARSMQLRNGGDSYNWFFLAMAHWQLGEKEKARKWFDRAVQWMEKNLPNGRELGRVRAEAAELLKIEQKKK